MAQVYALKYLAKAAASVPRDLVNSYVARTKPIHPTVVIFHCTFVCDARCEMCNNWKRGDRKSDMTLAQIEKVFSRSRIGFCPDVAHLTAGGGDPAELIRRYADRVVYAHLKDFRADPFAFLPLGRGSVDLPAVLDALKSSSIGEWVTVELDESEGAPGDAARESKAYLASLGVG